MIRNARLRRGIYFNIQLTTIYICTVLRIRNISVYIFIIFIYNCNISYRPPHTVLLCLIHYCASYIEIMVALRLLRCVIDKTRINANRR